jgi:hypothetical protein
MVTSVSGQLHREVEKLQPKVEKIMAEFEKFKATFEEVTALKEELEQTKKELAQDKKGMRKFKAYMDAMCPMLTQFGMYTFADGRKAIGVITRAFPVAGTVDIIAFDNGGSGGVYEVEGKTIGSGREQMEPFLSYEEEEEEGGTGADPASIEEADAVMAA